MGKIVLVDGPARGARLAELLRPAGHEPLLADNAWQGLAHVETGGVSLAIVNLSQMGLTGVGFVQDLRRAREERVRELPVIAMGELPDARARQALRPLRISAYLDETSCSPFELLDAVRAALADPRGHRWRYAG